MKISRWFRATYLGLPDENGEFRQEDNTIWASSAKYAVRAALRKAPAWSEAMDVSDDGSDGILGTSFVEGQPTKISMALWTIDDDSFDDLETEEIWKIREGQQQ